MFKSGPDLGFLHRTYRTCLLGGALVLFILTSTTDLKIVLGWACGVGLGVSLLKAKEWLVLAMFANAHPSAGKQANRRPLFGYVAADYLVSALVLYAVIRWQWANLVALLAGFTFVFFVIVARALGWQYFGRTEDTTRSPGTEG